jgi:seryl-tRNA synthetase
MLDLRYITENIDKVRENCAHRGVRIDLDRLMELTSRRSGLIQKVEELRRRQKEIAQQMKARMTPEARQALVDEGRNLKAEVTEVEEERKSVQAELDELHQQIPNMTHPQAPVGRTDEDNLQVRQFGEPTTFSFEPKDHVELGERLGILDFERAAKATGQKFYYLKGGGALLELALTQYAIQVLVKEGFTPVVTPDLARDEILSGTGFNPRGQETQIYSIENTDLSLIATAEITLGGMLFDEIIEADRLPLLYAGVSHCFRTEAGAHGKASKGLYRVHQFTKVEMFAFVKPSESDAMHERLVGLEEKIFQGLGIPFRVVDVCTGDLGGPAYRKYDLEAWMPGRGEGGEWGEVTSTSNCTDYQARRLKIRYRPEPGAKPEFLHMLNGTAIAVSRAWIAIVENYQQADGSILVPEAIG